MIASPRDVVQERQLAADVIHEWNAVNSFSSGIVLLPAGWETHSAPLMGDRPQEVINKQVLENSDLLIGVFWTRIGTPTGGAISGTVEEVEKHISAGKPAMLYFSSAPVHLESVDSEQYNKLQEFKESCRKRALFEDYDTPAEFRHKFARHLGITINRNKYFELKSSALNNGEETSSNSEIDIQVSDDAQQLVLEIVQDRTGTLLKLQAMQGLIIQTNGKQFTEVGNPRSEARWDAAVDELYQGGYVQDRGYKGEVFTVTNAGYELADAIQQKAE